VRVMLGNTDTVFGKPDRLEMYEHAKLYPDLYPIAWKGD